MSKREWWVAFHEEGEEDECCVCLSRKGAEATALAMYEEYDLPVEILIGRVEIVGRVKPAIVAVEPDDA